MSMAALNKFNEVLSLLPLGIKNYLFSLPEQTKCSVKEIRLRADKPIVIVNEKGCSFLTAHSKTTYIYSSSLPTVSIRDINETVKRASDFSVYSHQDDINNGFLTVRGGHRICLCGSAVIEADKLISVRNINSINIRIACERYGCADEIIKRLFLSGLKNIIIAGPPMCGKTTVLRDLVRQLSDGEAGNYYKCALVDERNEIASVSNGICGCNTGVNTDVLSGYKKADAISLALRTLSPEIIFCDEIADENEAERIINGINCGAHFVLTAHCGGTDELISRAAGKALYESGLMDYCIMLGTKENTGKILKISNFGKETYENCRNIDYGNNYGFNGQLLSRVD